MAKRPIYVSTDSIDNPYIETDIEFNWIPGNTYNQKCKRRDSLINEIKKYFDINMHLEISTKSNNNLGKNLSALNLKLNNNGLILPVEKFYQDGKIYDSNEFKGYKLGDLFFDKDPYGLFYDYIYILALYQNKEYHEALKPYYFFTDIEFNPNKSINTQARSASIFKTLYDTNNIDIINDIDEFKKYYKENVKLKSLHK